MKSRIQDKHTMILSRKAREAIKTALAMAIVYASAVE